MACGAISEPFPVFNAEALVAPRSREAPTGLPGLSEKQYLILADSSRHCRFF
jgi:hypothetical protein